MEHLPRSVILSENDRREAHRMALAAMDPKRIDDGEKRTVIRLTIDDLRREFPSMLGDLLLSRRIHCRR